MQCHPRPIQHMYYNQRIHHIKIWTQGEQHSDTKKLFCISLRNRIAFASGPKYHVRHPVMCDSDENPAEKKRLVVCVCVCSILFVFVGSFVRFFYFIFISPTKAAVLNNTQNDAHIQNTFTMHRTDELEHKHGVAAAERRERERWIGETFINKI